jgi:hypothetical protein
MPEPQLDDRAVEAATQAWGTRDTARMQRALTAYFAALDREELVQRGAQGLHESYAAERPTAYGPNRALSQAERQKRWQDVAIKSWYRRKAAAVVDALGLFTPDTEEPT